MSGVKRRIEDNDPDYEDITQVHENKRSRVVVQNARDAVVQKIEAIIKDQFSLEMKNKEHEIEVIGQRLNEARRMMDKLRACIVANYYASAGQSKVSEASKIESSVLNHPAIKRFLDSPSRSSSPLNQNSETHSQVQSETESLSQGGERETDSGREDCPSREKRPGRNTGKDTFGVPSSIEQHVTYHTIGDEASRLFVKKTIVVGNVSKYIAPDKREENDQSTHKWMVYVRGSRKEPTIDHFVKKPPFHLTRRGWGEFPVRVQIHFKDQRNKRIDIIHHLKLDRTYTGLQTLGAETVVDVEVYRSPLDNDFIPSSAPSSSSSSTHTTFAGGLSSSRRSSSPSHQGHDDQPSSEKGSPISTPSHSPLPRTPSSTPLHMKSSPSVMSSPYTIMDKPGQVVNMTASTSAASAPKVHTSSLLSSGVKVIIKQEPGEVPTQPLAQQQAVSTSTSQQQQQQYVTVKGGHMIAMSPQKQTGIASGAPPNKVLGIPLGSAVKQVSMSSGQILVAKPSPSMVKVVGQKQVVAQGVAKAIVSGGGTSASTVLGQQVHVGTKAAGSSGGSSKSGVMATLQLPANNLANLANLPPGTKLYLTTNSKNPSGKGKLLLIPQGAILRASHTAGQQSQSSSSGGSQSSTSSSGSGSLPSNVSYTSYIFKQTPQGTFLVGQPGGSGKQSSSGHAASTPASGTQQSIRVTAGQKAAILAQVAAGSQGSQVKLSDGSVKMVTAAATSHLSKPGTTTLRMTGGVITAASSTPTTPSSQQTSEGSGATSSQALPQTAKAPSHHPVLVAASQAAVINAAKNANTKTITGTSAVVTAAKTVNVPLISLSKGAASSVVAGAKTSNTSVVTAGSLIGGGNVSGKTAATISGMLTLHPPQASSQQTVLTIPANQLKQLSVGSGTSGLQTVLMPVGKVVQAGASTSNTSSVVAASTSTPVAQVKTEPGLIRSTCSTPVTQAPATPSTVPTPGALTTVTSTDSSANVKVEQGMESTGHDLNTEHIENMTQLLTAIVKKFPLIVKTPFPCVPPLWISFTHGTLANAERQRYTSLLWPIPLSYCLLISFLYLSVQLQRAVAVRRVCADLLERTPRLQALTPPRTREVMRWCRIRGYTPLDPEPLRTEEDSIEDILTQIDSEPECSSTLTGCEELSQRLEQLQQILKAEPDDGVDEPLDIISVKDHDAGKVRIKQEQDEHDQEPKFYMGRCPSTQFIRDTAEQIGIALQQVEVDSNAVEQFSSEILRESLANAHRKSQQNRTPREISAMDVHQAMSSIPTCDFLTNRYMGIMVKDEGPAD
ncbi:hypothetical protein DNTS_035419 [Danionella cerebrum]|uniref:YEATS domain-containing protein n=1 Tax=Danionella cerebrum TaxID=2873325 RepID=A0A553NWC9_9TELE|nr:hypothetical protein DNTS_035419 [Danionella translucida]